VEVRYPAGMHGEKSSSAGYLVRGVDTCEAATDRLFKLPKAMRYVGNYSYETVLGATSTVPILEPFDMAQIKPLLHVPDGRAP
jgi:hypothetical protein